MLSDMKIRLQDHQPAELRIDGAPAALDAKLELEDKALLVSFDDGRSVWIELENYAVRVHHFNKTNADTAPLNVNIPLEGEIEIDRHDYDIEGGHKTDSPTY